MNKETNAFFNDMFGDAHNWYDSGQLCPNCGLELERWDKEIESDEDSATEVVTCCRKDHGCGWGDVFYES